MMFIISQLLKLSLNRLNVERSKDLLESDARKEKTRLTTKYRIKTNSNKLTININKEA